MKDLDFFKDLDFETRQGFVIDQEQRNYIKEAISCAQSKSEFGVEVYTSLLADAKFQSRHFTFDLRSIPSKEPVKQLLEKVLRKFNLLDRSTFQM